MVLVDARCYDFAGLTDAIVDITFASEVREVFVVDAVSAVFARVGGAKW